jgi:hypothetical protein
MNAASDPLYMRLHGGVALAALVDCGAVAIGVEAGGGPLGCATAAEALLTGR